jgi:hypothetical protein
MPSMIRSLIMEKLFFSLRNRRHRASAAAEEERILQKLLEEVAPLLAGAELKPRPVRMDGELRQKCPPIRLERSDG